MAKISAVLLGTLALLGTACGGDSPTMTVAESTTTSLATTTTPAEQRQNSEELEAWRACLDERIDSIETPIHARLASIAEEVQEIDVVLTDDFVAQQIADQLSDPPLIVEMSSIRSGLRKRLVRLLEEEADLEYQLSQTRTLALARDGATTENLDWSLCASS